jgi:hypothetical protein
MISKMASIENKCFKLDHARSSIRLIQDHDFDISGFRIKKCGPDYLFGTLLFFILFIFDICFLYFASSILIDISCSSLCLYNMSRPMHRFEIFLGTSRVQITKVAFHLFVFVLHTFYITR